MVKFMFEDLVTEAEKKAEKKKLEQKIDGLLYGDEFGLSEEKLKAVAQAYNILGVDMLTVSQIKIALDNKIHETKEGPDEFFRMVNAEEEIKVRVSITKAMDLGILKYDNLKNKWYWHTAEENGEREICKTPPDKTPAQTIYDHYMGNDEFREDLKAVLITRNPATVKGKGKTADNKDE